LFKLEMALGFAIIVALVAGFAAFVAGARYGTILVRALFGFVASGSLAYAMFYLLDKYGMPSYLKKHSMLRKEWVSEAQKKDTIEAQRKENQSEEAVEDDVAEDVHPSGKSGEADVESNKAGAFTPLTADGLKHVSSPQD
jgi:hypothetical protein